MLMRTRDARRGSGSHAKGSQLRRALVIYMLHTRDSIQDTYPELNNFKYFQEYAVYGPNESTEMFEGVDYVFTRMVPRNMGIEGASSVRMCAEQDNVKLLWLPDGPCDLCGHHRVIEFLGGADRVAERYSYVVYFNAGIRGPFQHADDPAWIDVFAMSGHSEWTTASKAVLTGPAASCEQSVHLQSYAVGLPSSILPYADRFLNQCLPKLECVRHGEVAIGREAIGSRTAWLHVLSRNLTITSMHEAGVYCALHKQHFPAHYNPIGSEMDMCSAVFLKYGGNFFDSVPDAVASQIAQLTIHQSSKRRLGGHSTLSTMVEAAGGRCPFLTF